MTSATPRPSFCSIFLAAIVAFVPAVHAGGVAAAAAPPVPSPTGWSARADDSTHMMTIWHGASVVRVIPIAMGNRKHPTPNGIYHTMQKFRSMVMDSSTFGVPVDSPEGYRTPVEYATRLSWDGIFIHAAPWSVMYQGRTNVSHGCINVSTADGRYVYDEMPIGSTVEVIGTSGGTYTPGT